MSGFRSDDYGTPEHVLDAAHEVLGEIDLDPFSSAWHNKRVGAEEYYDSRGIEAPWCMGGGHGTHTDIPRTVWCNPPYGRDMIGPCVDRWIRAAEEGEMLAGLILTNAATSSKWCRALMEYPHVMLAERLNFVHPQLDGPRAGNLRAQMITYAGCRLPTFRRVFGELGVVR